MKTKHILLVVTILFLGLSQDLQAENLKSDQIKSNFQKFPNLKGNFLCTENQKNSSLTLDFYQDGDKIIFYDDPYEYIVDDQIYPLDWGFLVGTYQATVLSDQSLKLVAKGHVQDENNQTVFETDTIIYEMIASDELLYKYTYDIQTSQDSHKIQSGEARCKLNQNVF